MSNKIDHDLTACQSHSPHSLPKHKDKNDLATEAISGLDSSQDCKDIFPLSFPDVAKLIYIELDQLGYTHAKVDFYNIVNESTPSEVQSSIKCKIKKLKFNPTEENLHALSKALQNAELYKSQEEYMKLADIFI